MSIRHFCTVIIPQYFNSANCFTKLQNFQYLQKNSVEFSNSDLKILRDNRVASLCFQAFSALDCGYHKNGTKMYHLKVRELPDNSVIDPDRSSVN